MNDFGKANQGRRLIYMLNAFLSGKNFTCSELKNKITKDFGEISLRTVQRDLQILVDCNIGLENERIGNEVIWRIPKEFRKFVNTDSTDFSSDSLLAFYFLKAHLKAFKGTVIEKDANILIKKIEEFAPASIISTESLYWDQNIGTYNYSNYDLLIQKVIYFIHHETWIKLTYNNSRTQESKTYTTKLKFLFQYSGSLYAVAYVPKYKKHISLAIQNIEEIDEDSNYIPDSKELEFDFDSWIKTRFGIFDGNIEHVKILVKKAYRHYFENRRWHPTQRFAYTKDDNLIITMNIPLNLDFRAWILSWSDAIEVLDPLHFRNTIIEQLKNSLKTYETLGQE